MASQVNNVAQALRNAIAHHRAGSLAEAEAICRQILQRAPHHPEALYLLGLMACQTHKQQIAVDLITQAIAADSTKPAYYNLLGKAFNDLGQWEEAISCQHKAISLQPDYAEAYVDLGNACQNQGKLNDAIASYNQVIALNPDDARAYNYLGNVHNKKGNQDAAVVSYQKALSLKPDYAVARYNLGNTFMRQGKLDEAVSSFKKTLLFTPEQTEKQLRGSTYCCLGHAFQEQGNGPDAVSCLNNAISLLPDYLEAYNSLGNALLAMGNIEDAIVNYRKAIALRPEDATAHGNLGNAYQSLAKVEEAVECYGQALLLDPDYIEAHSSYLMVIQYSPKYSEDSILNAHRAFAEKFEAPFRQHWPLHENSRDPERRLKVGFVSGDFRIHPVGFFVEALLTHLDCNTLEVVLYSNYNLTDEVTLRLKSLGYLWRSLVGVTDDDAAKLVRDDGIDILIDLSGHTHLNRLQLFARKPAPVQVAWLGYFDTTGLQAIDYILGDPYMLPPDEADHYVETPWRLPESYLCFTPPDVDVMVEALPAISNGFITFGSFNNLTKLNDEVVALWARVLQAVPNSRLFLKTQQFKDLVVRQTTAQRFSDHGIDGGRLIFEGSSSHTEHFSAYNRMDVSLDPFPFPGGTTSVNALWMGVPVLHLQGHRFISHAGESILINVGLPEWIAADADDYVRLAQELTGNLSRLSELRVGLRRQLLASPLCDAPRFALNFEVALRGMWRKWCSKSLIK